MCFWLGADAAAAWLLAQGCVRVAWAADGESVGRFEQFGFAADGTEDRGAADCCGGGDLFDRGCRVAAFWEQAAGGSCDREPGRFRFLAPKP